LPIFPDNEPINAMCLGYISGTLDTVRGMSVLLERKFACEPPGVTGDQLVSITIKYLADHPGDLHFSAASLILDLYTKSFPCKGQ
jgi:Rap1a immunity proteins